VRNFAKGGADAHQTALRSVGSPPRVPRLALQRFPSASASDTDDGVLRSMVRRVVEAPVDLLFGASPVIGGVLAPLRAADLIAGALRPRSHGLPFPSTRATIASMAKSTVDALVAGTYVAITPAPRLADLRRIRREVNAAAELYDARGWLDDPTSFHVAPPPLSRPRHHRRKWRRLEFDHLEWESGYEPHRGEPGRERWLGQVANRTAHAWLLRHGDRPRPWMIGIHGIRMGSPAIDFPFFRPALLHFRYGFDVAIPVLPLHGPRRSGFFSGSGVLGADAMDTVHAIAQAIWDVRRLLGWIRAEGGGPIGVHGMSLGGYTAALLATIEDDLAAVVLGIPASDFVELVTHHYRPFLEVLARWTGLDLDVHRRVHRVISPLASPPRVPFDRRFLYAGIGDRMVPIEQSRRLWEHWDRPRAAWYDGSHLSFPWEPGVRKLLREAVGKIVAGCPVAPRPRRRA
jgi:hypothetical protein